jgi:hypothetical protein
MDSKVFVEEYKARMAEHRAKQDEFKDEIATKAAARKNATENVEAALKDVVLPYLNRLKAEFPPKQFTVMPSQDSKTSRLASISFKIGDSPVSFQISNAQGAVNVKRVLNIKGKLHFQQFPASGAFRLRTATDLTEDNVGELIRLAMNPV